MDWEEAYDILERVPYRGIDWIDVEGVWLTLTFDHPDSGDTMQFAVGLDGSGRRVLINGESHEELYEF